MKKTLLSLLLALLLAPTVLAGGNGSGVVDGEPLHVYDNAYRSINIIHTPNGVYGVLDNTLFKNLIRNVKVTYLFQSKNCDERSCEIIGYKSANLPNAKGFLQRAGRVIFQLDDGYRQDKVAQGHFGNRYYSTSYLLDITLEGGEHNKVLLIGYPK